MDSYKNRCAKTASGYTTQTNRLRQRENAQKNNCKERSNRNKRQIPKQRQAYRGDNPVLLYVERAGPRSKDNLYGRVRKLLSVLTGQDKITKQDTLDYPWHKLTPARVQSLRNQLERFIEAGIHKPSYCNTILCTIRRLLKHCYDANWITFENYHRLIDVRSFSVSSNEQKSRAYDVTPGDIEKMLKFLPLEAPRTARNHVILLLAYNLGLRCCEIVNLDVDDYDPQRQKLHVRGKGRKYRCLAVEKDLCDALDAWLLHRKKKTGPLLTKLKPGGRLNIDEQILDKRMQPTLIGRALHKLQKRVGIKHQFTPHDLRRARVTTLLRSGVEVSIVQRLMGHASPITTSLYDCIEDDELDAIFIRDQKRSKRARKRAAKAAKKNTKKPLELS